jgi:hypothetical protein
MFEAKGVTNAKERLQLLVGDVRQPFPAPAQEAQVGPHHYPAYCQHVIVLQLFGYAQTTDIGCMLGQSCEQPLDGV